jgi:RNA polymerase sigma-70 factor, ECF subfamily
VAKFPHQRTMSSRDPEDERVVIERARSDPDAFGVLFDRYFDSIFGYLYRRSGDWDLARDLSAEVFLKAFKHLWRFRWSGKPFSSWLYAIATNEFRMHLRRSRRARASFESFAREQEQPAGFLERLDAEREAIETEARRHRDWQQVQLDIRQLPLRYQDVLVLRYIEQKSLAEIASILGKRLGTVKSLLSRGLARLRRMQPNDRTGIALESEE